MALGQGLVPSINSWKLFVFRYCLISSETLRLPIGIGGLNHPTEKPLYHFTATFKAPLLALEVNHCRHLIAQMDGERFFVADPCHQRVIAEPTMPSVHPQPKTVLQS